MNNVSNFLAGLSSLFSPAFDYLRNCFAGMERLFPVTVIVAIALFILKEAFEWRRRTAADDRKVRALKKVIARECELNYWALSRLTDVFNNIRDAGVGIDARRIKLSKTERGDHVVTITDGNGTVQAGRLPCVQRDALMKHLVEIAALDQDLYAACEENLDGLAQADHVHASLVYGPDANFPSTLENYYGGLSHYSLDELVKSTAALKALYKACTGSELTRGKLR